MKTMSPLFSIKKTKKMTLPKNNLAINKLLLLSILAISCTQAQRSSTECEAQSPQCCWVKRSWELMGQSTSVSFTNATACCQNLGDSTQTSGIPGVTCTSTGNVTEINWFFKSLKHSIPSELGNLGNLWKL